MQRAKIMNVAHLKNGKPDVFTSTINISARFAVPLTIKFPIKHLMKNSVLFDKSSDEIAQINAALFQLAARIENNLPPELAPIPFADMMPGKNRLETNLKTSEEDPVSSELNRSVKNYSGFKNTSTRNGVSRNESEPSPTQLIKAEFHLEAPAACSVKLAADFTDWEKHPLDLIKSEDGVWFTLVPLSPGQYAYRFIVDGQWRDDPHPRRRTPNPFGTVNAVVVVG
jgi:hypothetical protein